MTQDIAATESSWSKLPIDKEQAQLLDRIGRELASAEKWWGELEAGGTKSVIEIRQTADGSYSALFREVVGVVVLGNVRIRVAPKIPRQHFNYIVARSNLIPRVSSVRADLQQGDELEGLVARWLVESTEKLLRAGLAVDYNEYREELFHVRGRLDAVATTLASHSGRAVGVCEFEELSSDTALNRILKAGCERVASFPGFDASVRKRAKRALHRMTDVGPLRHSDHGHRADRLTRRYRDTLLLAHLVLRASGIDTSAGNYVGSAFLLRTPGIIEEGMLSILSEGIQGYVVNKRRRMLGASGLSLNPDLIFSDGLAVGDIKYRFLDRQWDRGSLYQAVTFATGFNSTKCAIVGFKHVADGPTPCRLAIGNVEASAFAWDADPQADPRNSACRLIDDLSTWLSEHVPLGASVAPVEGSALVQLGMIS